ncbi:MAG: T9SS type A sorting domain-containing protein [Bacteroidota bacterium]|nr:T9SS type A sorting domain-containing protein [Bacteroidota bacterium]
MKKLLFTFSFIVTILSNILAQSYNLPFTEDFTATATPSATRWTSSGITRTQGTNYTCGGAIGNPLIQATTNSAYMYTSDILVPQGTGVSITFNGKRGATTISQPVIYFRIGGHCTFSTSNLTDNEWTKLGTANLPVGITGSSCGSAGTFNIPREIAGGNLISFCIFFPNGGSTPANTVVIDDINIYASGAGKISNTMSYSFTSNWWPTDTNKYIVYHSNNQTTNCNSRLLTGGVNGTSDYYVSLNNGNEICTNLTNTSGIVTKELNIYSLTYPELRYNFLSQYPCGGPNSYVSDEDYSFYAPKASIMIGMYSTNNSWKSLPVKSYFPNNSWKKEDNSYNTICYDLSAYKTLNKNVRIKIENGGFCSSMTEGIDEIKIIDRDCRISKQAKPTITGINGPWDTNKKYNFSCSAVTYANYYKWMVRKVNTTGDIIYSDTSYITSGQGTRNVTIRFANAGTYRVYVLPYDANPNTSNGNECYSEIGYFTTSCAAPRIIPNSATGISDLQFTANWNAVPGVTSYYLDVATDSNFTNIVTGFNNLNVGNVTSYIVRGISSGITYYYRVKGPVTCTGATYDYISVTTCTTPSISAQANGAVNSITICKGDIVNLTGNHSGNGSGCTGTWKYLWSSGDTTENVNSLAPSLTTTYTLTVKCNSQPACYNTNRIIVNVNQAPVITDAGSDITVCNGSTANFSITASNSGSGFKWQEDRGSGFKDVVDTGNYSGSQTALLSIKGCKFSMTGYKYRCIVSGICQPNATSTSKALTVNQIPVVNAGSDVSLCNGSSIKLTATGASTYTWSNGLGIKDTVAVNPTVTSTYIVTGTLNGCGNRDTIVVSVNTLPTISATPSQTICKGSTVNLKATGGVTYKWSTGSLLQSISVAPTATTTYKVTVNVTSLCSETTQIAIKVDNAITANAGPDRTVCKGNSVTLTGTGGTTYSWSTGTKTASITLTPTITKIYILTAYAGSCSATDLTVVSVSNQPIARAGANRSVCKGKYTFLIASGGNYYKWSNGSTAPLIIVSPQLITTYTVTATNLYGCSSTSSVVVTPIYCKDFDSNDNNNQITFTGTQNSNIDLNIYPNPGTGIYNMVISSPTEKMFDVKVMNILGIVVFEKKYNAENKIIISQIDISNLPEGVYMFEAYDGNNRIIRNIIKN